MTERETATIELTNPSTTNETTASAGGI